VVVRSRSPIAAESTDRANAEQTPRDGVTPTLALRPQDVLALQRSAGNRAVLARLGEAPTGFTSVINTGLRRKLRTDAYAKLARDYWADPSNKDKPLKDYADFLIDEANAVLKKMGSFEVKRLFSSTGSDSGTFGRVDWRITVNTAKFSKRTGVSKVSDLTLDEAAEIADTIYHEVRHSEQYFRIARVRAAESKKKKADIATDLHNDMDIPIEVAQAAAAVPLKKSSDVAYQIAEAKEWESITIGLHAEYKGIINTWGDEADEARDAASDVKAGNRTATKAKIGAHVDSWRTASRGPFVDSHLTKVEAIKDQSRMDKLVVKHLKAIKSALAAVFTAWKAVEDNWATDDGDARLRRLQAMQGPLRTLASALYAAYRDHLHEKDAWQTGAAVGAEFRRLGAPAPAAAASGKGGP
jgi:hypothetical protein